MTAEKEAFEYSSLDVAKEFEAYPRLKQAPCQKLSL